MNPPSENEAPTARYTFDGERLTAREEQTDAAALFAAGVVDRFGPAAGD